MSAVHNCICVILPLLSLHFSFLKKMLTICYSCRFTKRHLKKVSILIFKIWSDLILFRCVHISTHMYAVMKRKMIVLEDDCVIEILFFCVARSIKIKFRTCLLIDFIISVLKLHHYFLSPYTKDYAHLIAIKLFAPFSAVVSKL